MQSACRPRRLCHGMALSANMRPTRRGSRPIRRRRCLRVAIRRGSAARVADSSTARHKRVVTGELSLPSATLMDQGRSPFAAHRRQGRLLGHRSRRLPRVRAPDRARAHGARGSRCSARIRDDRGARHHPAARLPARAALPGRPGGRRARRSRAIERRRDGEERGERARAARGRDRSPRWRPGADVIYQATFFDGRWLGYADFLLQRGGRRASIGLVDGIRGRGHEARASRQGGRRAPDLLVRRSSSTRIQGVEPEWMQVALGGSARETVERSGSRTTWPTTAPPSAGSRRPSARPRPIPGGDVPEPVEHCDVCRWDERCDAQRRADDDLSLVAGIAAGSGAALVARGISTHVARLAGVTDSARSAARRHRCSKHGARPTAGARSRSRARCEARRPRTDPARAGLKPSKPDRGWRCSRRRIRTATCSSTSRAIRSRSTTASTTSSASWMPRADPAPSGRLTRTAAGEVTSRPREGGVRAAHRPASWRGWRRTRPCTSTTTRPTSRPP